MTLSRRTFGGIAAASGFLVAAPAIVRAQAAQRLVMGSPMPSGHSASTFVAAAADAIRKETNGAIDIFFAPDSQLGTEADMQRQLRTGAIQLVVGSCSSLQAVSNVAGIPGVAYAFKDYTQLWAALDGDLGDMIRAELTKLGMVPFKCLDNGFRNVTTSAHPINAVADLKGLKIRVPPSRLLTVLFENLGASPVTISIGELYSALQTKIADGMENSLVQFEALKIYEVQKYCSMTRHSWDGLWIMANAKMWADLPANHKTIIQQHFDSAVVAQQQDFAKQDIALRTTLETRGLHFNDVDRAPFVDTLQKAGYYKTWKEKFGADAWSKLEKYTGPLGA